VRRVVLGSCALAFAAGWNVANVGPIAEHEARAYGVRLAVVGLFTTSLFVGHLLVQVPGGRAIDAFGARRLGLLALAWIGACNSLLLLDHDPGLGIAVRGLAGLGTGVGFVAASDYARSAGTPLAQGIFGGASNAGAGAAIGAIPQLDGWLGWRAPYWTALVLAAAALPLLLLGRADRVRPQRDESLPRGILSDRRLYRLGAMHAATFGLSLIAGNWVVTLLSRTSDYSDERAGAVGTFTLVAGLLTRPFGGVVLQRGLADSRRLIAGSLVAGTAGTIGLAAPAPVPIWIAYPAAILVGLAAGLPFAAVFTSGQRLRPDAPGAAVGMVNALAILVILVGTPLAGLAFSLPGDGRIGFAAIAALWAAALLVLPSRRELAASPSRAP
jgi:MFS transporter, NNP family, nitrate/nitrite transporter